MNQITKIKNNLYLGNVHHVARLSEEFVELKIDVVINCCDDVIHKPNDLYVAENYPIDDDGINGSFEKHFVDAAVSIHKHLTNGSIVYVHCMQGVNRSAAVILYYLMKYDDISFNSAWYKLYLVRPCVNPINAFVREIKKLDVHKASDSAFLSNRYSDI